MWKLIGIGTKSRDDEGGGVFSAAFLGMVLVIILAVSACGGPGDQHAGERDAVSPKPSNGGAASQGERSEKAAPSRDGAPDSSGTAARTMAELEAERQALSVLSGVYGDGEGKNAHRDFFVYATCDGLLAVGAMWGDVAPWILEKAEDDSYRELNPSSAHPALEASFRLDGDGNGAALKLGAPFADRGWMARLRDLPKGWNPECGDPSPNEP